MYINSAYIFTYFDQMPPTSIAILLNFYSHILHSMTIIHVIEKQYCCTLFRSMLASTFILENSTVRLMKSKLVVV